jgi:hypothetical protein
MCGAIAAATVVLPVSPAGATCQSSHPRMRVKVIHYSGAEDAKAKSALTSLFYILREKFEFWKADIKSLASEAPFLAQFDLSVDQAEVAGSEAPRPEQVSSYWITHPDILQIVYGSLFSQSPGGYVAESTIYLGSLVSPDRETIIHVTLPIDASEAAKIIDTHSLIAYYALGLEAYQLGCPSGVFTHLLDHANQTAATLLGRNLSDEERTVVVQTQSTIKAIMEQSK